LGSYHWKTEQNLEIAKRLFDRNSARKQVLNDDSIDYNAMSDAVRLAKTDLTTELVKEFTELQGIIGGKYAREQMKATGIPEARIEKIGNAIEWQYRPANTDDAIPPTAEGQLLGLADRIQTITAMFNIGHAPTGSKDPFALRRAANAIVKILAETTALSFTLSDLVTVSAGAEDPNNVKEFLRERLHFYLKDVRGFAYDVVNAVLAAGADDVRDAIARAEALTIARESADFAAISAAFKRIKNILRQAEEKGFAVGSADGVTLAAEAQQLSSAAAALAPQVAELRGRRSYGEALTLIATLRPSVDAFFDKVMVLDPDPAVRGANLGLIAGVLSSFSGIADFSEIVTS
jgi:glycyl-tRNA synthetase beta chain